MNNSGLGVASVCTIVFTTLKLVGTIGWSWWWVLSPLWISTGLTVGFLGFGLLCLLGAHYLK